MLRYKYLVADQTGKKANGKVEAANTATAQRILHGRGLVIISLTVDSGGLLAVFDALQKRITLGDVSTFTRQFATMVGAGVTVTEALSILRDQVNLGMSQVVDQLLADVESGTSLSSALEKHEGVFSPVYISLIRSGETGGILDQVLTRLADNLEKQREFQGKLMAAMIYPIVVIIGIFIVLGIMLLVVIPKMAEIYKDFEAQIPLSTKIVFGMSGFLKNYWYLIFGAIAALVWGVVVFSKTPFGRMKIDQLKLKLPVIGLLLKDITIVEFTRTLGMLVGAGVSILESLHVVAKVSPNKIFIDAVEEAAKQVEKGFPLAYALGQQENVFSLMVARMIAVGEETGKMDEVLAKIAHILEVENENKIRGLTSALEPIIMVFLGVTVGFLVFAMIMPVYNLTSQVSK